MLLRVAWVTALLAAVLALLAVPSHAYTVGIKDKEGMRQACSGMYAGKNTSVDVMFDAGSKGQATTIVYEISEFGNIGKFDPMRQQYGQLYKTYVCSSVAVQHGLCKQDQLGMFIVDESLGQTYTIQQKQFNFGQQSNQTAIFSYNVTVDGYYCVGVAEVSSLATDESQNGNFNGRVVFHNIFKGNLPAAEHPKLLFYGVMTLVYLSLGVAWLSLCTIHRDQIVTVQHFISAMIAFLVLEMACEWLFYAYYNNHEIDFLRFKSVDKNAAVTGMARFLLVLTSILGAARDSLSFFLLLIVSMGYGVVRPTIGSVIRKVQLLTGLHFIFGVLYSVGIVLILLEMGGSWTLLFIFPLAGTLSAFMSWILYSLKSTMQYLSERRQTYKFTMFQRLYLILMCAVVAIVGFFFFSSFLLATSDTSDLATTSWEYRWFVLDGSLTLLYFIVFASICYVWRPTGQNMRLAMSDELATDEEADAGQYEVHTLGGSDDELDQDAVEVRSEHLQDLSHMQETIEREEGLPKYSRNEPYKQVQNDDLVFDADDQEPIPPTRTSYDAQGNDTEREHLQLSDDEDKYAQKSR